MFCLPILLFQASAGIALRSVIGHVASSVKSAMRAHTSHASRCPASEAAIVICGFSASEPRLRTRPAEGSQGALNRRVFGFRSVRPQLGVAGFRRLLGRIPCGFFCITDRLDIVGSKFILRLSSWHAAFLRCCQVGNRPIDSARLCLNFLF